MPAVGTLSHVISGLTAGLEYTFFTQLTSVYGKKGAMTSFVQSTYTDVTEWTTNTTTNSIVLNLTIESGVGDTIDVEFQGTLGSVDYHEFIEFQ